MTSATTTRLAAEIRYRQCLTAAAMNVADPAPTRLDLADRAFLLETAEEFGATCGLSLDMVKQDLAEWVEIFRRRFREMGYAPAPTLVAPADEMTIGEAALAAGYSENAIRLWCQREKIGHLDRVARRYIVSRAKLKAYLMARHGRLPVGLHD